MNTRQESMVKYFHTHRTVKNNTLAIEFNVSLETIRRDLMYLEKQGVVIRMHGGAYLNREFVHETDYLYRATLHSSKKKVIAEKQATLPVSPLTQDRARLHTELHQKTVKRERGGSTWPGL